MTLFEPRRLDAGPKRLSAVPPLVLTRVSPEILEIDLPLPEQFPRLRTLQFVGEYRDVVRRVWEGGG